MSDPEWITDYRASFSERREIECQGYLVYKMCEVPGGCGSNEKLDGTAKDLLRFVTKLKPAP